METIKFSRLGLEDLNVGTGTFEVTLADGRVVTLQQVNGDLIPWQSFKNVEEYASFAAAVTAIGDTVTTLLVGTAQTISSAVTVPSTLHILVIGSGSFTKSGSGTLTINGPFEAPLKQVFFGFSSGNVTGLSVAHAEWWGGKPSATAAVNTVAIASAVAAITSGDAWLTTVGSWDHEGISLADGVILRGLGVGTVLLNTNNATGVTLSGVDQGGLRDIKISQSGNSNSVDAITFSDSSNNTFFNVIIDTPGRYAISMLGGSTSGCFQNDFFHVDITGLSGTKRGINFTKPSTFRNNGNRFIGGRINNGAYGIYADTDSGNNNVFSLTVQEQTTACVYDDSQNNSYQDIYIETNQTGAHGFQIGSNGSGMHMAPRVLTVNGGGDKVNKPSGSPTTNNTYTLIPPSGSTEKARLESVDVGALRSDLGSGTGQYAPVLKKTEFVNFSVAGSGAEVAASFTLPASSLTSGGDTIRVTVWGTTTNAAADKKIDLYFGASGTRLVASVNSSTASVLPWKIEALITRTGAATQNSYSTSVMGQGTSFNTIDQRTNTPDQTLASDVVISVELTGAGGAGTVTMSGWLIEML